MMAGINAECFLPVLRDEAREIGKGQTMEHWCAKLKSLNASQKVTRKSLKGFKLGECMILCFKNTILAVIIICLANFYVWKRRFLSLYQVYILPERFQTPSSPCDFPDEIAESFIMFPDLRGPGCKSAFVNWSLKMKSP